MTIAIGEAHEDAGVMGLYRHRATGEVALLQRDRIGLWRPVPERQIEVEGGVVNTFELLAVSDWEAVLQEPEKRPGGETRGAAI